MPTAAENKGVVHPRTTRLYSPEDGYAAAQVLMRALEDDPITPVCLENLRGPLYEARATAFFSWFAWGLTASYPSMQDVAVGADGTILAVAVWEPAGMSFGAILRTIATVCATFIILG